MSVHSGHRQRLKERFKNEGLDHFGDLYVLELLLFYCVPRKDTNEMAHAILSHFGSAAAAIEAPVEELERVKGIGPGVSTFFSLIHQVGRFCELSKSKEKIASDIDECAEYMKSTFKDKRNETIVMLCLDAKCKILCCKEIAEGGIISANVSIRRIVEVALASNATTVVLGHNHPSGIAVPSADDILTTKKIDEALRTVDVTLADHIVYADGDWVSMVRSGYFLPKQSV